MTGQDVIDRVRSIMGDKASALFQDTEVLLWIDDASIDIAKKTLCLPTHSETDAVADDYSYELPNDYAGIRKVTFDGKGLIKTTAGEMDRDYPDRDITVISGTPWYFYIYVNMLFLYPAASSNGSGNLDIFYARTSEPLDDADSIIDLPVRFHSLVVRYALAMAKELAEEYTIAKMYMTDYETGVIAASGELDDQYMDSYPSVREV